MRCSERVAVAALAVLTATHAIAEDLGILGPVYPIAEPNLLQVIHANLARAQADGRLKRLQEDATRRVRAHIESPPAVPGLTPTRTPRRFHWDPSIAITAPVLDAEGHTVIAAGTTVNPLQTVSLSKRLVFLDGRDSAQVRAVESHLKRGEKLLPILTSGSPTQLARRWRRLVFFDQGAHLTGRFGITQIPAVVRQDGLRLRIDEVKSLEVLP